MSIYPMSAKRLIVRLGSYVLVVTPTAIALQTLASFERQFCL